MQLRGADHATLSEARAIRLTPDAAWYASGFDWLRYWLVYTARGANASRPFDPESWPQDVGDEVAPLAVAPGSAHVELDRDRDVLVARLSRPVATDTGLPAHMQYGPGVVARSGRVSGGSMGEAQGAGAARAGADDGAAVTIVRDADGAHREIR